MFCQYQFYRWGTRELQTAVDHSDEKYQCKEMSDCPYTGTTVINNIPWVGEAMVYPEEDQAGSDGETEDGEGRLSSRCRSSQHEDTRIEG